MKDKKKKESSWSDLIGKMSAKFKPSSMAERAEAMAEAAREAKKKKKGY